MNNKQTYLLRASFAILIFVLLGYVVKFYPEILTNIDSPIQSAIRSGLNQTVTHFFKVVTFIGNTSSQVILAVILVALLYWKRWKVEAGFLAVSAVVAGLGIITFKNIYDRPRPSIAHLVEAHGFSFPSGHSMGTMMIIGALIIILSQRMSGFKRTLLQLILGGTIFLVGLSRIYLGVHYPTDVLAGFTLGYGFLNLLYPFYNQLRFKWRFQAKQK